MSKDKGRLVYSSGPGGGAVPPPAARSAPAAREPRAQQPRVKVTRAGRSGKTVTLVEPLFVSRETADELLKAFKRGCGAGGTLVDTAAPDGAPAYALEVQGDHAAKIVAELVARGYQAKRAGG